ncbi:ATP-binding protein [Bradyrhizobium sp. HKCCYLRH3099]|uniref:ATP-binding protein n=1 Tax=unclassified Bradyrhizobium TaxID=2631580 RepID=UPI003EBED2A8
MSQVVSDETLTRSGTVMDGRVSAVAEPRTRFWTMAISVATASFVILAVELIADLQPDLIVSLLMLAVAAIIVMAVLTSMLIRNSRHAVAMAEALARQNEQLAHTTRLLNEAQRIGRIAHWTAEQGGESSVWSEQLFDITGLEPQPSVAVSKMIEIIHPDDVSTFIRARERTIATGCALQQDVRIVRPDGEIRWIRMVAEPIDDVDGKFRERFGIVQDITERKAAEIAAEQAQQLLLDAIEALTKGFVLFDNDDRFVLSNTRFREMFPGWARLMRPGISFTDLMRRAHDDGLIRPKGAGFEQWLERKRAWHLGGSRLIEHREINGRWIQSVDHRISDGGTVCLVTDITAFKTVQAELEQKLAYVQAIRADLEEQKRELEATGAELRAARDAAEAANRAKSDFLAIMSHEIRTPLSGMVGMVDLLRGTRLTDEQKRYTALAKESADLLLDVINDILDFSKLEAGRLQSESIDFDVRNLVESAVSFMGERARKRSLDLKVSLAPELPQFLKGDPTRIRQVVLNLVANAIKFTERGGIDVRASHRAHEDGAIDLRIEVIDTGIGMSPEIQAQIFDPFVQADTSITRKYGGSGLGLAICKQLCTIMGGNIGVDSQLGRGSRFWFEVRCRQGEAPVLTIEPIEASPDRPLDILVAEDSPIIATLISSLLVKQGFRPTIVVNGVQAIAAVFKRRFDLVLMDVQMPEMDGMSATRAIRELPPPACHTPIIALTANALVGQRETYLAAGMNDYVTKPIQPPLLFEAIRRWALPQLPGAPPLQPGACESLETTLPTPATSRACDAS